MNHAAALAKTEHSAPLRQACEIGRLDARAQAKLVADGELAARDLVEAAILRIEALNAALNAVVDCDFDAARERAARAAGPMAGAPWLLKDGLDYPGMATRCGSRSRRDAPPVDISFPFTERFDAQGFIALGKTNVSEFALLPTTEALLYGPAINPWAPDRSPGGSSGGSAVAVASGMTPIAHAADGGGSIRIPASCCGLVGLKPGRGANVRARGPHIMEDLLSCDGVLSRTVRDTALAFAAAAPAPRPVIDGPRRGSLRIALVVNNLWGEPPHRDVENVLMKTAHLCEALGHDVDSVPSLADGPDILTSFRTIWGFMAKDSLPPASPDDEGGRPEDRFEPWTIELASWSDAIKVEDVEALYRQVGKAAAALDACFREYDVILSPVLSRPALPLGALAPTRPFDEMMDLMFDYVSYTPLHNITGHPAISLPLFEGPDGTPVGAMFAGPRGGEDGLLRLAYQLEEAQPWRDRWPEISIRPRA